MTAISDFSLPLMTDSVRSDTFRFPGRENTLFAFWILFLSGLQAEISDLTVHVAAILDLQILLALCRLCRALFIVAQWEGLTSKAWYLDLELCFYLVLNKIFTYFRL